MQSPEDGLVDHRSQYLATENRFHEFSKNSQNLFCLSEIIPAIQPSTMVLSGPWLIADENVKSQLCKEAKSTKMEGMGIAEACRTHKKHVKCLV